MLSGLSKRESNSRTESPRAMLKKGQELENQSTFSYKKGDVKLSGYENRWYMLLSNFNQLPVMTKL